MKVPWIAVWCIASLAHAQECGPALGVVCPASQCCSVYMWCGSSPEYCAWGNCVEVRLALLCTAVAA